MPNPDVVAYLRQFINKFPVDALRRQLQQEGVPDADFDEALKFVLRTPIPKESAPGKAGSIFLVAGIALVLAVAFIAFSRKESPPPDRHPRQTEDGAYLGRSGYVIRLPEGYAAYPDFKDQQKTIELVHFAKRGTDPTNFIHEGLFGQLGIVRLEVEPSRFTESPHPVDALNRFVDNMMQVRGETFNKKALQVSSLKGVQVTVESPFQRTEAYILGEKVVYVFNAGQDDEIFREIVMSLRETVSEM
ncbi:MAG: hypothetical protein HY748_14845 [Elusimicrobia bacterium]|nr:hypothetical protein [Elusimicrobiota bacterium]